MTSGAAAAAAAPLTVNTTAASRFGGSPSDTVLDTGSSGGASFQSGANKTAVSWNTRYGGGTHGVNQTSTTASWKTG